MALQSCRLCSYRWILNLQTIRSIAHLCLRVFFNKPNYTHKSWKSSRLEAGVNTSRSPITWLKWKSEEMNTEIWEQSYVLYCLEWNAQRLYSVKDVKLQSNKGSSGCVWVENTHILMLHVFEQSEFPVGPLSKNFWLKGPVEFLDGHFLLSLLICYWTVMI